MKPSQGSYGVRQGGATGFESQSHRASPARSTVAPGTGHRALPGTGRGQPRVGKGTFTPWHNPGPALPKKQPWEQVFRDGSPVLAALVLQKLQGEPEFSNT